MLPPALFSQLVSPDWRRNLNIQSACRCILSVLNLVLAGITLFLFQTSPMGAMWCVIKINPLGRVLHGENLLRTLRVFLLVQSKQVFSLVFSVKRLDVSLNYIRLYIKHSTCLLRRVFIYFFSLYSLMLRPKN